ncbi:MAG: Phage integrase [Bifidobacterium crudilactis]|jgi:integrase
MASVESYETKAGKRFTVRYRKPDHSMGRKRGFKRKKDAVDWAAEHVTVALASDTYVDPAKGKALISDLYQSWYAEHSPLWKQSWRHTVEISWNTHVKDAWGDVRIMDMERASVQQWVSALSKKRSASTVLKAYGILRSIVQDAVKDRILVRDPLKGVVLPRKPKRKAKRVYLTVGQLIRFADECRKAQEKGEERRALILLLGFCGLRWGEAAALQVSDVDYESHRVIVRRNVVAIGSDRVEGTPKSGEMRTVPLPSIVEQALMHVCLGKGETEHVFLDPSGRTIRPQSVGNLAHNRTWYVSALKRLNYSPASMPSPHDLRHTAASIAVHAGANVKALQRMLGHTSAAMTLDVYADLFDSDLDDVARMIDSAVAIEVPTDSNAESATLEKVSE